MPLAAHQQTVDQIQAQIRADLAAGRRSLFRAPPPKPERSSHVLDGRIEEELQLVVRQLGQLGDVLADDPILLLHHTPQLQSIDLMQQVLGHLARIVASADKAAAVDRVTLSELKVRLQRQALRAIAD